MIAESHWGSPAGRFIRFIFVTFMVLIFFFLAIDSLVLDSPTMDEQNHIARGLAFLRTGDPRLSLEHPPLINGLSALPLLMMPELRLPLDHPSWERREGWYEFADLFMWQYNHDVDRVVFLSRLPIVYLLIFLSLTGYRFAKSLWGGFSGLVAMGLILFEPNLLAHGRYATTDLGGTFFIFLATFALWQLWQFADCWNWRWWFAAAIAMGFAFGSKLSALGFVPIWGILALLPLYPVGKHTKTHGYTQIALRRLAQWMSAGTVSLLLLWMIFGLEWGTPKFTSPSLVDSINFPIPMPTFWAGLEQLLFLTATGRSQSFLLGNFSEEGFLSYFAVAFLAKTPIFLLLLLPIAIVLLVRNKHTRRGAIFLLVPTIGFFLLTMQSALNIGFRHLLPILPVYLVLISGIGSRQLAMEFASRENPYLRRLPSTLAIIGVGLSILLALWIHPHYLSYFNLAAGGPVNGYRVLTDSNVDWGQDLRRLKNWMVENRIERVKLGWFGSADPNYYDIDHDPLPGIGRDRYFRLWWDVPFNRTDPEPGIYAISASSLWELPLREEEKTVYAWFRFREPDEQIGHSILIYYVP
jgi:hypothetical protein